MEFPRLVTQQALPTPSTYDDQDLSIPRRLLVMLQNYAHQETEH